MSKLMITYHDPETGAPRAWARGPASRREEIEAVAREQLETYCAEGSSGHLQGWTPDQFTRREETTP